jgi:hypothetical protein
MIITSTRVDSLCNAVMHGVAGAYTNKAELSARAEAACEIMRDEVKAFIFDERYASERACVLAGSLSDRWVVAAIVANCIARIAKLG